MQTSDPAAVLNYIYAGAGRANKTYARLSTMAFDDLLEEFKVIDRRIHSVKAITDQAFKSAQTGAQDGAQKQGPDSK